MSDFNNSTSRKAPDGALTVAEKPKVKILETFSHPKTKRISQEPLPDEVVEQMLAEADQLFAKAKSKAVGK